MVPEGWTPLTFGPEAHPGAEAGFRVRCRREVCHLEHRDHSPAFWALVKRVLPDLEIQGAIIDAATAFENTLADKMLFYNAGLLEMPVVIETERHVEQEMMV